MVYFKTRIQKTQLVMRHPVIAKIRTKKIEFSIDKIPTRPIS